MNDILEISEIFEYVRCHPVRAFFYTTISYVPKKNKHLFLLLTSIFIHNPGVFEELNSINVNYTQLLTNSERIDDQELLYYFLSDTWDCIIKKTKENIFSSDETRQFKQYVNRFSRNRSLLFHISEQELLFDVDEVENLNMQKRRRKRKYLRYASWFIAILYAFGMLSFAIATPWNLPWLICVSIVAAIVYFISGKSALYYAFKQIFFNRVHLDANGESVSSTKKHLIRAGIVLSVIIGVSNFFLYFHMTLTALMPLFGIVAATSLAATPPGLIVLACIVAMGTGIACAAMFYCAFSEFIKRETWRQVGNYLKNIFCGFYNTHWPVLKWQHKCKHVLRATGLFLYRVVKLLCMLGLSAGILFVNYAFFQTGASGICTSLNISNQITTIIAQIWSWISASIGTFFSVTSISAILDAMRELVCKIYKKAMQIFSRVKGQNNDIIQDPEIESTRSGLISIKVCIGMHFVIYISACAFVAVANGLTADSIGNSNAVEIISAAFEIIDTVGDIAPIDIILNEGNPEVVSHMNTDTTNGTDTTKDTDTRTNSKLTHKIGRFLAQKPPILAQLGGRLLGLA